MERSRASRPLRVLLTLLAWSVALAQEPPGNPEGGRDGGEGRAIHFVRWRKSAETAAVYNAAWRALEPHLVDIGRRRLVDFDGDPEKARAYFAGAKDVALVVAFGAEAAAAARSALAEAGTGGPGDPAPGAPRDRSLRVADRGRRAPRGPGTPRRPREASPCAGEGRALRARRGEALGPRDEALRHRRGRERLRRRVGLRGREPPRGRRAAGRLDGARRPRDRHGPPRCHECRGKLASLVVGKLRDGREPTPQHVHRLHVAVDLDAAPGEVDLRLLAHADAVRRGP